MEEQGTHDVLLSRRGAYYDLVIRQLDEGGNAGGTDQLGGQDKEVLNEKEKGKSRKGKERKEKKDKTG